MKSTLLLPLLMLITFDLDAQSYRRVSGFQGARWNMGFGVVASPSYEPQVMQSENFTLDKLYTLNVNFSAHLEYTIGHYKNFGLRVGMANTSAILTTLSEEVRWTDNTGEHYLRDIRGTPGIKDRYAGVYIRYFLKNRGALAPIGMFVTYGINVHHFGYDYSAIRLYASDVSYVTNTNADVKVYQFADPKGSAIYPEIFLEGGKIFPVGNHLLFEISCKGAFLFTGMGDFNNSGVPSEPLVPETLAKKQIRNRLIYMNILNYGIKISGLW